ncbi:MAG: VOC family protein [Parvularculaceae bacterium]
MLDIEKVDHIGIRVSDKSRSIDFYKILGFKLITDAGFEKGHPVIMQHSSGVVLNLLGPSTASDGNNILMDVDEKYSGITHVSYKVKNLTEAKTFLANESIPLTGEINFKSLHAVFIRDPDRNVIELDAYEEGQPGPRQDVCNEAIQAYQGHPV